MKMKTCFYYDYAGGTYYAVDLQWFFNCPPSESALVWTDGRKIVWHLHGSTESDGSFNKYAGYHEKIEPTDELLEYFQHQRRWQNEYNKCKTREERRAVNKLFND